LARASNVGGTARSNALAVLRVDDELEIGRLLNGKIGRFLTSQDFIDIDGQGFALAIVAKASLKSSTWRISTSGWGAKPKAAAAAHVQASDQHYSHRLCVERQPGDRRARRQLLTARRQRHRLKDHAFRKAKLLC
jgi:hypothetical protein